MRQIIPRSVLTRFPKVHLAVERKSRHSVFSNRVFSPGQFVHPADRVKYWNIVPKDTVRILKGRQDIKKDSDGNDVITPVLQVDQFKNRVFPESGLKQKRSVPLSASNPDIRFQSKVKPVHYSNVQLFLGNLPPKNDPNGEKLPTYAVSLRRSKAIVRSKVRLDGTRTQHRLVWKRFATKISPPDREFDLSKPIPWPTYEKIQRKDYTDKETSENVLNRVTFNPSPLTKSTSRTSYDYILGKKEAGPIELAIAHELANPHSKHKRAQRYAERQRKWAYRLQELEKSEKSSGVWTTAAQAQNEARRLWTIERAVARAEQKLVDSQGTPEKRENKRVLREAKKAAKEARRSALLSNLVLNKDGKIVHKRDL
ncbi:hypothetical protein E3Q19_02706 [Wallemia mellicola]|nr:hypothetical protein E3Q19_02706 [Wallemia mellicola]